MTREERLALSVGLAGVSVGIALRSAWLFGLIIVLLVIFTVFYFIDDMTKSGSKKSKTKRAMTRALIGGALVAAVPPAFIFILSIFTYDVIGVSLPESIVAIACIAVSLYFALPLLKESGWGDVAKEEVSTLFAKKPEAHKHEEEASSDLQKLKDDFVEGAKDLKDDIVREANDAKDTIVAGAKDVRDSVSESASNAKDGIVSGANAVKDGFSDGADEVKKGFSNKSNDDDVEYEEKDGTIRVGG